MDTIRRRSARTHDSPFAPDIVTAIGEHRGRSGDFLEASIHQRLIACRQQFLHFFQRHLRRHEDVEDVLQDFCLKVIRGARTLRDGDRIDAWLHRVSRNTLIDHYRQRASWLRAEAAYSCEMESIVSGFLPIRSEMDLGPLMAALAGKGARLCLPAILDRTTMVFRACEPGAPLVDMGFGTQGPGEAAAVLEPAVMLVPLAAFDARGDRIGYGAGHYDRAIARLHENGSRPRLIGVAFDCQRVEAVPVDGPVDILQCPEDIGDVLVVVYRLGRHSPLHSSVVSPLTIEPAGL